MPKSVEARLTEHQAWLEVFAERKRRKALAARVPAMSREEELEAIARFVASGRMVRVPSPWELRASSDKQNGEPPAS